MHSVHLWWVKPGIHILKAGICGLSVGAVMTLVPSTVKSRLASARGQCPDCLPACLQKKSEAADYHKLLMQRLKEQRERRSESLAKKRAVRMASQASKEQAA